MKRRAIVLLLIALTGAAADLPSRAEIDAITAEVSTILGWKQTRSVPVSRTTREELNRFLRDRVARAIRPSDVRAEELTLKWLGLVPGDFDLKKTTIDLLTEQAAAFYDYKKKKLVLLENPFGEFDRTVLAHELAHALADQRFRIGRYMDDKAINDDTATARQAVVEGQASWLMNVFDARREGRPTGAPLPFESSLEASPSAFPVLERSPLYLRVSLLFPYWEGARFQQAVVDKLGPAGLARVFEQPPASTQQILHPEMYLSGTPPEPIALPEFKARGYRALSEGMLGELDHLVIFKMAGDENYARTASAWRGGRYRVLETKARCCVVLYSSRWTSDDAAEAAKAVLEKHHRTKAISAPLRLWRTGSTLEFIEGDLTPNSVAR